MSSSSNALPLSGSSRFVVCNGGRQQLPPDQMRAGRRIPGSRRIFTGRSSTSQCPVPIHVRPSVTVQPSRESNGQSIPGTRRIGSPQPQGPFDDPRNRVNSIPNRQATLVSLPEEALGWRDRISSGRSPPCASSLGAKAAVRRGIVKQHRPHEPQKLRVPHSPRDEPVERLLVDRGEEKPATSSLSPQAPRCPFAVTRRKNSINRLLAASVPLPFRQAKESRMKIDSNTRSWWETRRW